MDELLRVLREEAANEERTLREESAREAERVVAEARDAAVRVGRGAMAHEEAVRAARLKAVRDATGLERGRALLLESRRQLDALRTEAIARLPGAANEQDVARLVGELMPEAGPLGAILVVDPGFGPVARAALAAFPDALVEVREAPAARGGVELETGALVLDDRFASRLERAWERVEPEIAGLLFSERPGGEP